MKLECSSCGHEWEYRGENEEYVNCPECHYEVEIPATAQVVEKQEEDREQKKINIPVKAKVIPHDEENRFNEKEEQFMTELEEIDEEEDLKRLFSKYDQEEFNVLKKKIKNKSSSIRRDLKNFEEVKTIFESIDWNYSEL